MTQLTKGQRVNTPRGPGAIVGFEGFINNGKNGVVLDEVAEDFGGRVIVKMDDPEAWVYGSSEHPDPYFFRREVVPEKAGFTWVTKEAFFAYVGPRDICVSTQGSGKGMYSVFETRTRQCVGEGHHGVYMLKTELVGL